MDRASPFGPGNDNADREAGGRELLEDLTHKRWASVRGSLMLGYRPPSDASTSQRRLLHREQLSAALVPAAARGDVQAAASLLRKGADANAEVGADDYVTPLAWAARCDHPRVVGLLIAHGADVNKRFSFTPWEACRTTTGPRR